MNGGTAWRKALLVVCSAALAFSVFAAPKKDKILIGASRSLTGGLAIFEQTAFGPIYKFWIKQVNEQGGIYVKEYGKKLPVEIKVYDDESDTNKMVANLQKLITVDKVDLILPPAGTDMLFAAAPVANELGYVLVGAEGGAARLSKLSANYPFFFSVLNYSDHNQVPVLVDAMVEKGVKSVAMVYLNDLHGIEYSSTTTPLLKAKGINLVLSKSIPVGVKDLAPILKEAKAANPDAFLIYAYPDENILAVNQAMEVGFNPKLFLCGPGANFQFFADLFGPAVEGIMGWGAWNVKSSPANKEFAEKLGKEYGPAVYDWWGHNVYYAALQALQKAIESVGSLDQKKIRDALATQKFDTILGKTWFDSKHLLAVECYTGQLGQWQKGIFEVIGPKDKATAKVLYPKPAWPAKK
jgi:branched-chain amino acid transport system substrate-binding protein